MSDDTISEVDTMFMKKSFDEIDMKTILIETSTQVLKAGAFVFFVAFLCFYVFLYLLHFFAFLYFVLFCFYFCTLSLC